MNSLELQVVLLWGAVTAYVVVTVLILLGLIFRKPIFLKYSTLLVFLGALPHTAAIILRWVQTGHFPYWGKYEVFSSYPWAIVVIYLAVVLWKSEYKVTGAAVFPIAFFMTGMALTGSTEIKTIPSSYLTYWLGVHVAFAKLAYGSALIAGFYGVLYMFKDRAEQSGRENGFTNLVKSSKTADFLSYRFSVLAFVTMTMMIGSGAVWAYKAWGRYWGWDPVETWSLVCWILYGIILHLRTTMGWQGRKAALLSISAVFIVIFAFFGMPAIYDTVHEHLVDL